MNHRKHKQQKNLRKLKKENYDPFVNDPVDAKCPYCGEGRKICSYLNSLNRAFARSICKTKYKNTK